MRTIDRAPADYCANGPAPMRHCRRGKFAAFLAVALSGGTLFGTCQTRIHDSIINGTQIFILSLFDPSNVTIE